MNRTIGMAPQRQEQLFQISDFLPDATWAIDTSGTVIAWNKAAEELTGVKSEDMVGKGNFEYSLPFYGARRPMLIDLSIASDQEQEEGYEYFSRTNDVVEATMFVTHLPVGGLFLWAKARNLVDDSGAITGAIETVRDLTEIKHRQEITIQMEKTRVTGGLAAGVAHHINNPLGVIMQNIQNIERRISGSLTANDRVAAETGLDFEKMQHYLKQRGIFELLEMISAAGMRVTDIITRLTDTHATFHTGADHASRHEDKTTLNKPFTNKDRHESSHINITG